MTRMTTSGTSSVKWDAISRQSDGSRTDPSAGSGPRVRSVAGASPEATAGALIDRRLRAIRCTDAAASVEVGARPELDTNGTPEFEARRRTGPMSTESPERLVDIHEPTRPRGR